MGRKKKIKAESVEAQQEIEPEVIPAPEPFFTGEGGQRIEIQRHADGTLASAPGGADGLDALRPVARAVESAAQTIRELSAAGSLPAPGPSWTPAHPPFKLLKEDAHWFSLQDYGAVLGVMAAIRPQSVLEFGPGPSTLALVEGGATSIDTCEDVEDWARVWDERLVKRFPGVVRQHRYTWPEGAPLSIRAVDGKRFDMCLIDGPRSDRRADVLRYCLPRCSWILMPTEEEISHRLRPLIVEIAEKAGRAVRITETGPRSGAFALIGPAGA